MKQLRWMLLLAVAVLIAACKENINTPGQCPDLCPGEQIGVRDTVLLPIASSDSSYFGYLARSARTVLLVSNGLPAGEYRSFLTYPKVRTDSVTVDATRYKLTVDTASFTFNLKFRDTTATGLTIYLHRLPLTVDTTIGYPALAALLAATEIVDSIQVPDTLKSGTIEALIVADELAKIAVPVDDSGQIAFGFTVRASKPTGIGLSVDVAGSATAPVYETRGHIEIADTSKVHQKVTTRPADLAKLGYFGDTDLAIGANPDLLYLGGPTGARALIRFAVPDFIRDSTQILRATLELTPALPLIGLPDNVAGDSIALRGVQLDLGAKSTPIISAGLQTTGRAVEGTTNTVLIDLILLATQWQLKVGPPTVVFLANNDEAAGGGFMQPVFYSTRSPTGQPRLRITYGLKSRPGKP